MRGLENCRVARAQCHLLSHASGLQPPVRRSRVASKMAAFCEEFTLCTLAGAGGAPQGPLGLEQDADRVLLTDRGRTVTLYKVSDQKPLGCWSVKQGQTITCPAVCNSETGEFILVHDDKVLQIWKEDDTNLDKVFKATLSADVYRIHSLPYTEPLVLFKGGAVKNLDALLAAPQQEIENIASDEVIRWSDAFRKGEQYALIFITEQDGNCFIYVQQSNPYILQKFKLEQGGESSTPLSFAAYLKDKVVTLLCLYSSGCLYKVLVPLQWSDSEEEQILQKSLLIRLLVSGSILKRTSIAILDKDHIAITGCLDSPDGNIKGHFSIWNIKFQTLQASKELPWGTTGQCWCYGDKLFVTHGKELTVILYKCQTSSLAAAVGKIKDIQISEIKTVPVNWNILQEDDLICMQPDQPVPAKGESNRLLRSRKNIGAKTQLEILTVKQLLSIIKDSSQNIIEEKLKTFLSSTQIPDFQASVGCILSALVNKCKSESSFYPHNCLVQLIQTQGLSYSMCPDLMAVALEKTDIHLLQLALQQFPDIPEVVTCACLRAFLSIGDDRLEEMNLHLDSVAGCVDIVHNNKTEQQSKVIQNGFSSEPLEEESCDTQLTQKSQVMDANDICPVGPQKATLLNTILRSAYSETFLLPHLKDLSAEQVILFLRYLQYLYVKCSEDATMDLPGMFCLTINQIIDWICLLLDAHFTVIVMLPEARKLLSKLHKFVRAQVRFYSELNKIEGSLNQLQMLQQPKDVGLYSIEILKL
ncbi:nucleolar protein 11 [Rhineura floridana]|uniref:nucleolar protein 11 n=1 Tax=Rhineura floridana TaxID=261503 RepID=UPI002AC88DAE|nr:nucleolar protein 11 [Rhineura floridana]